MAEHRDTDQIQTTRGEMRRLHERAERSGSRSTAERVWDVVIKASVPLVVAVSSAVISHEVRLSRIEETRFTEADAAELRRELVESSPLVQTMRELRAEIRDMRASLEKRIDQLERNP